MEKTINSYKDLIAWQKAIELVTLIYQATREFPVEERFGIVSQLNRASVSVPSNIAEGWGRQTAGNYTQFLRTARGSLMEIETLLIISRNLEFLPASKYEQLSEKVEEAGRILHGLIKSIKVKEY